MSSTIMKTCIDINLSESELHTLVKKAKDWIIMHGAGIRSKTNFNEDSLEISPFLLLPSSYPRKEFERGREIQTLLNELLHKVAYNYEFLTETLKSTIKSDNFTAKLCDIHRIVYTEGFAQNISLGLLRSDYMLHSNEGNKIKQVEINAIASSFGGLAPIVSEYHKFILEEFGLINQIKNIPENNVPHGFSTGLIEAWKLYNNKKALILIVVEDITHNICDQRVIEFTIQKLCPQIKIIRRSLTNLITEAKLGSNKELLIHDNEVAVVYYRSGYQPSAYPSEKEWDVRLLIERSRAIKCPSIQYHLAGTKKIQQRLAVPGILEKFISDSDKVAKIKEIFMELYTLDLNEDGDKAVAIALKHPEKYVLKPQREGGGNNVFGNDIKNHLEAMINSEERSAWILMERIFPSLQKNYLIQANVHELKLKDVLTEMGIYGVIIGDNNKILHNTQVGHILRTKPSSADEGGIIYGAGALDSPYLVD